MGSVESALLAAAYPASHGLPAPRLRAALTTWTVDPAGAVLVATAGVAYLAGVLRLRRRGGHWPVLRSVSFLGLGLGTVVIATMSWFGVYAHTLFWAFTFQLCLLLLVAPLFLATGEPVALAVAALPPAGAERLSRVLGSRPFRVLTFPVMGPVLLAVIPLAFYLTPWFSLTLRHQVLYELMHVGLVAVGFVFALPLTGAVRLPGWVSHATLMFLSSVELFFDAVPGIVVRLTTRPLAGTYYLAQHRTWAPLPAADQRTGGAVLWFFGEVVDLPFLAITLLQWIRVDEKEAAEVDRALSRAAPAPVQERAAEPGMMRPWWEVDGSVFGQRARHYGWGGAGRSDDGPAVS